MILYFDRSFLQDSTIMFRPNIILQMGETSLYIPDDTYERATIYDDRIVIEFKHKYVPKLKIFENSVEVKTSEWDLFVNRLEVPIANVKRYNIEKPHTFEEFPFKQQLLFMLGNSKKFVNIFMYSFINSYVEEHTSKTQLIILLMLYLLCFETRGLVAMYFIYLLWS